ncbi:UNVERIFIED_CONTAM: hypothetical protein Sangu_3063700 [Sesamum angustifolium]|uniref:Uncharacterized protein n=1 Tax=Sesamum angustifolium TaxID=2727405 RepID=A0AAW2KD92_9LAMI
MVERHALWDALQVVSTGTSPWIVGGDFSTILSLDGGGRGCPSSIAMWDCQDAIADYAFVDAYYHGNPYTSSVGYDSAWIRF